MNTDRTPTMVQHSDLHVVPCDKPRPFPFFNLWLNEYGTISSLDNRPWVSTNTFLS